MSFQPNFRFPPGFKGHFWVKFGAINAVSAFIIDEIVNRSEDTTENKKIEVSKTAKYHMIIALALIAIPSGCPKHELVVKGLLSVGTVLLVSSVYGNVFCNWDIPKIGKLGRILIVMGWLSLIAHR